MLLYTLDYNECICFNVVNQNPKTEPEELGKQSHNVYGVALLGEYSSG